MTVKMDNNFLISKCIQIGFSWSVLPSRFSLSKINVCSRWCVGAHATTDVIQQSANEWAKHFGCNDTLQQWIRNVCTWMRHTHAVNGARTIRTPTRNPDQTHFQWQRTTGIVSSLNTKRRMKMVFIGAHAVCATYVVTGYHFLLSPKH